MIKQSARVITFLVIMGLSSVLSTPLSATLKDVYVVLFILDGVNFSYFDSLIKSNQLPNTKKYFYEEGIYYKNALSVFPTCSASVYQSLITGLWPGESGIVYLKRFDKRTTKLVDYLTLPGILQLNDDLINTHALLNPLEHSPMPPTTLFEYLKDLPTATVYSPISRGAKTKFPRIPVKELVTAIIGNEAKLDTHALKWLTKAYQKPLTNIPRFSLVALYGADMAGHHHGAKSKRVKEVLKHFDDFLPKFIHILKSRKIYNKTYLIIISDHGMHDTPHFYNLHTYLHNNGFRLRAFQKAYNKPYDIVVALRGIASAHIYIKGSEGWKNRPTLQLMRQLPTRWKGHNDLIATLLKHPGTDLVVVREEANTIRVFSNRGNATIHYIYLDGQLYVSYQPDVPQNDPLGYAQDNTIGRLTNGSFHYHRLWGKLTAKAKYPNAPSNLAQIFMDGKSGNIWLIADEKWTFKKPKKATHGSLLRDDMHIILAMHSPLLPREKREFAQSIDVFPTIADWFGIQITARNQSGTKLFSNREDNKMSSMNSPTKEVIQEAKQTYRKLSRMVNDLESQHHMAAIVWQIKQLHKDYEAYINWLKRQRRQDVEASVSPTQ